MEEKTKTGLQDQTGAVGDCTRVDSKDKSFKDQEQKIGSGLGGQG